MNASTLLPMLSPSDRIGTLLQRAAGAALALLVPLTVFPQGASIPEHAKISAMGVLLTVFAAAALWTSKPFITSLDRWSLALMAGWLALLGISTLLSVNWDRSLYGVHYRYNGYLLNCGYALMALLAAKGTREDRRFPIIVLWATAAAACIAGLIGVAQYLGVESFWLSLAGVRERPRGTFSNTSLFGAFMAFSVPLLAALALQARHRWSLALIAIVFAVAAFGWRAAASRGSWLAGGAALAAIGVYTLYYSTSAAQRQRCLVRIHALAVLLLAIFVLFPPERFFSPLNQGIENRPYTEDLRVFLNIDAAERLRSAMDQSDLTRRTRMDLWKTAWNVWREYPWFGAGPDTYSYFYQHYRPAEDVHVYGADAVAHDAHNLLLHNLAVWGTLPTLAWLALLARAAWAFARRIHSLGPSSQRDLAVAILISFIAAHAMQLVVVGSLSLHTALWLLLGAMIGFAAPASNSAERLPQRLEQGRWVLTVRRCAALAALSLCPMWATVPLRADAVFMQGTQAAAEERMEEALIAYERAVRMAPFREEYRERLCAARLAMGVERRDAAMIQRAEEEAQRLIDRFPMQSRFYALRGRIAMLNADRFDDERWIHNALADFRRAVELHPVQPVYHGLVGQAAARIGGMEEARTAFERAIILGGEEEKAFYEEWLERLDAGEEG